MTRRITHERVIPLPYRRPYASSTFPASRPTKPATPQTKRRSNSNHLHVRASPRRRVARLRLAQRRSRRLAARAQHGGTDRRERNLDLPLWMQEPPGWNAHPAMGRARDCRPFRDGVRYTQPNPTEASLSPPKAAESASRALSASDGHQPVYVFSVSVKVE